MAYRWDQDDANKAERLRNLARRLEHEEPGVSGLRFGGGCPQVTRNVISRDGAVVDGARIEGAEADSGGVQAEIGTWPRRGPRP